MLFWWGRHSFSALRALRKAFLKAINTISLSILPSAVKEAVWMRQPYARCARLSEVPFPPGLSVYSTYIIPEPAVPPQPSLGYQHARKQASTLRQRNSAISSASYARFATRHRLSSTLKGWNNARISSRSNRRTVAEFLASCARGRNTAKQELGNAR